MSTHAPRSATGPRWAGAVGAWLRWGALAFSLVLIAAGERPVAGRQLTVAGTVLLLLAVTAAVAARRGPDPGTTWLTFETLLATGVVIFSGGWASPFGLYLAVPVFVATLRLGTLAVPLPLGAVGLVAAAEALGDPAPGVGRTLPLLLPLLVTTTLALGSRRWGVPQPARDAPTGLGRLDELGHVNALLARLHQLVRSSPTPLTVEDVLGVVHRQVEEMFDPDAVVLLLEGADGRWWRSVDVPGTTPVGEVAYPDLPAELLHAGEPVEPVMIARLGEGGGLTPAARSGVYQWLFSRGRRAALLAIERNEPGEVPAAHLESLSRLAAPLALALDNAVWFSRLQTLGAEFERQRLGTQLHDRFAQSLAYVGLELDRAVARHAQDTELLAVRDDVKATLGELRETLRELRLRCSEERGLADTLAGHLQRFEDRVGMKVELDVSPSFPRLALPVENHLLRAVQELVDLAHQRSSASGLAVRLLAEDERLRVLVRDDGAGVAETELDRDSAGVLAGIRERADAIGARVDVRARADEGTEVAMTLRRT